MPGNILPFKSKSLVYINHNVNNNVSSKLSLSSKRSSSALPQNFESKPNPAKTSTKPYQPKQHKLPSLPYQVADTIIQLVGVKNLTSEHYHLLRELGSGWSCVIDYVYLPFFHKSASLWYPYIEDQVPEGALSRSCGKFFKLSIPNDSEHLQRLCWEPKSAFPSGELKLWCNSANALLLQRVSSSIKEVSKRIRSLTFVVGSTLQSVRVLYDALAQMTNLEDLRVICIQKEMESMLKEIASYTKQGKPAPYPHLTFSSTRGKKKLACLSVSGYTGSFIFDDLFECYGKKKCLKCLELGGQVVKVSQLIGYQDSSKQVFPAIEKLKICAGDNYTITALSNKNWPLTHISLNWNWNSKELETNLQPKYVTLSKILKWLKLYKKTLTELYLYVGCPTTNERSPCNNHQSFFIGDFLNVKKVGFPYMLAVKDAWIIKKYFRFASEIELHDWNMSLKAEERGRKADSFDIMKIRPKIRDLWLTNVKRISVWSGKTEKTEIYERKYTDEWCDQ